MSKNESNDTTNNKNKINSKLSILFIVAIIVISSITYVFFQVNEAESFTNDGIPRAAIIDQLYEEIPNENFNQVGIFYLEEAGYAVDVYRTGNVTVDLFKKLPEMGYKIVIVRTHGVVDPNNQKSLLFTGERYSEEKYISEQLLGQIERATPTLEVDFEPDYEREWTIFNDTYRMLKSPVKITDNIQNDYFAIGPKFVNEQMRGKFSDTIFLLGGCNTGKNPSLAKSLIDRGASYVVAWDNTVGAFENDKVLLEILSSAILNENDFLQTVESISHQFNQHEHPFDGKLVLFS